MIIAWLKSYLHTGFFYFERTIQFVEPSSSKKPDFSTKTTDLSFLGHLIDQSSNKRHFRKERHTSPNRFYESVKRNNLFTFIKQCTNLDNTNIHAHVHCIKYK